MPVRRDRRNTDRVGSLQRRAVSERGPYPCLGVDCCAGFPQLPQVRSSLSIRRAGLSRWLTEFRIFRSEDFGDGSARLVRPRGARRLSLGQHLTETGICYAGYEPFYDVSHQGRRRDLEEEDLQTRLVFPRCHAESRSMPKRATAFAFGLRSQPNQALMSA